MLYVPEVPRGIIDDSLGYLVTSLELSNVKNLPSWIQPYVPKLRSDYLRRSPIWEEEENPATSAKFIGKSHHPIERVSAQNLPTELALLGIVPRSFSIYIKRVKHDTVYYRLNIRWSQRPLDWDGEQFANALDCRQLFEELQLQYSWNVTGTEFEQKAGDRMVRSIVLDFRSRQSIVPSMRYGIIHIKNNQLVHGLV